MTANEFFAFYAKALGDGWTPEKVVESGGSAIPCDCKKPGCVGWVMWFKCNDPDHPQCPGQGHHPPTEQS